MLKISDLRAFIGENMVLRDVSLQVPHGESIAVLGANGAGKSSLIRVITGLLKCRQGKVLFEEKKIQNLPPHQISRLGVACVPEGRHIFVDMSTQDNLYMGAYLPQGRKVLHETLSEVMDLFPALSGRLSQRAGTLSGGEQQMLAIGRALMARPRLLISDELSLGLAPFLVQEIYRVLRKVGQKITMLLVDQGVEQTLMNSTYAYVLETGKVLREGPSAELMDDPSIKEAYLGI
jgi:branched-chain amino acid transport system ATP-binding protein